MKEHKRKKIFLNMKETEKTNETIFINQFNTLPLGHFSYYIESDREAAIVDPMREYIPYVDLAEKRNAKIKYILMTHIPSDFISGHFDIQKITNAKILYGTNYKLYDHYYSHCSTRDLIETVEDEEELSLGNIRIIARHTPGNTIEATSYLLVDQNNKMHSIFTGDTLLIGSVGAPDIAVCKLSYKQFTNERELSEKLYYSLKHVISNLPNDVAVFPGHNNIAFCLHRVREGSDSTIGEEKVCNPYLNKDLMIHDKVEEFIELILKNHLILTPRQYYHNTVLNNLQGYEFLDDKIFKILSKSLDLNEFKQHLSNGCVLIDTRDPEIFAKSFIPGAISINLKAPSEIFIGTIIKPSVEILLIIDEGREEEVAIRLLRVGYDNIAGYLKGGMNTWINSKEEVDSVVMISHQETVRYIYNTNYQLLDVREEGKDKKVILPNCVNVQFHTITLECIGLDIPKEIELYVFCLKGYKSLTAISILKRLGYHKVFYLEGGLEKLEEKGIRIY